MTVVTECETTINSAGSDLGETPSLPEITVLLVEDNPGDAVLTKVSLGESASERFHVIEAQSLAEARRRLSERSVDVVLLDLGLPDSRGLDTFTSFHSVAPDLPVIVLSGLMDEESALKAVQNGAQDYLIKGQTDGGVLARAVRYAVERQRIERALQQEHNIFSTLMENIPDFIYFKDRESRFVRVSQALARKFRHERVEEIIGKTDFDFFAAEHAQPAIQDEREVIRTETPIIGKVEKETALDGAVTWALTTKMPWRNQHNQLIGTFGVSKDITQLKMMEDVLAVERNLLRSLIDALPDHIYVKDRHHRFIVCNTAVARSFGLASPEDIVGKRDSDFFPHEDVQQFEDEEKALLDGTTTKINRESEFVNHDGQQHWMITSKVPLRDRHGAITGLVGINLDITERKRTEEMLNQLNLDLARSQKELLATYDNLKHANEELKATQWRLIQAEKLESIGRLAAGVAHEVKNPLATLLMGVQYLGDSIQNAPEDVAMTLAQMQEAIQRADAIVRGLLDVAASGDLELTDTSLNRVVEQSLVLVRHQLREKQIQTVKQMAENLPRFPMDARKIEQVFINLFINAVHAMPLNGVLTVRTLALPGTQVAAIIEDNGSGIPADLLSKIFDPFFSTKPTGMGSGLGLAVARNILDLHGGKIEITNRSEGGARVTVTFETKPQTKGG